MFYVHILDFDREIIKQIHIKTVRNEFKYHRVNAIRLKNNSVLSGQIWFCFYLNLITVESRSDSAI